jgi:O-antigen/teichoic acid export membrane protein
MASKEAGGPAAETAPPGAAAPPPMAPESAALGAIIARNAVFTVAGRMFFLVAWAAVTPYMLHMLGENRFAIWALFFALSGYFATFDLGLSQALVKFVAQFSAAGDARALRAVVTLGTLVYAALTAPVVVVLAAFQRPVLDLIHTPAAIRAEAGFSLVGMAVVLGLNNLVGVMTAVLTGRQRMDVTNRIILGVTALQVVGAVAVLAAGWGLRGLVVSFGAGVLLSGLLSWRAMRAIEPGARFDPSALDRRLLRELLHFSAALQITNLGTFLQFQLDKFLLAHFVSLAVVTRYELAYRLAFAAWAVPSLLLPPLVPAVSHLGSTAEQGRILRLYARASRYLAAASFPIAAFVIVAAPALVTGWLGPGYPEAAWATAGLIGFLLFTILTGVGTAVCRGIGEPWMEARYHILGTAVHLALSLLLVPRYGLAGALGALGASGVVAVTYFLWRFHVRIGEPVSRWIRDVVAVPALASAAAAALALAWRGGWWTMPAGRAAALVDLGRVAVVFVVVIGVGYFAGRTVTLGELRGLRSGLTSR